MKLKEFESFLSQCEQFKSPKIELEQYATSSHIAARMIYSAQDHIHDSVVCDLGSGCGVLSVGSVMAGARYVVGFEVDDDAIELALENRDECLDEDSAFALDFVQTKIQPDSWDENTVGHRFQEFFDVVIMNPPFGTKNNAGADFGFLKYASKLVKPGGHIYSLHKTSTRPFFEKKLKDPCEMLDLSGNVLAEVRFDVPKCYKFHKEKCVDIFVDFWQFEKKCNKNQV